MFNTFELTIFDFKNNDNLTFDNENSVYTFAGNNRFLLHFLLATIANQAHSHTGQSQN